MEGKRLKEKGKSGDACLLRIRLLSIVLSSIHHSETLIFNLFPLIFGAPAPTSQAADPLWDRFGAGGNIKKFANLSPVNMSMINSVLRPANISQQL
ncbi:hypothetical protein [Cerasicoccus maritimus]|uniref:hypothetical protein n=1 Tax=Cerasicoccus maritimus TaxID=490089 RepID=UPI002852CDF3|nr:hypothetical protein [Cerasicoccus maritimus]